MMLAVSASRRAVRSISSRNIWRRWPLETWRINRREEIVTRLSLQWTRVITMIMTTASTSLPRTSRLIEMRCASRPTPSISLMISPLLTPSSTRKKHQPNHSSKNLEAIRRPLKRQSSRRARHSSMPMSRAKSSICFRRSPSKPSARISSKVVRAAWENWWRNYQSIISSRGRKNYRLLL